MAINPILENAAIQRSQDMYIMKHNVDQKGIVDQGNIQHGLQKTEEQRQTQVIKKDDPQMGDGRFNPHGHSGNEYQGDGGRKRKDKHEEKIEGKVIKKSASGFDMKI